MDPVANPFRPGAGRRPPVLAGREPLLDAFDVVRARAQLHGEGDRSWIVHGLRGVGKTSLLNHLLGLAHTDGWIAAKVEASASTSLALSLSNALVASMRTATGRYPEPLLRRMLGVFKAFSIRVDPNTGGALFGADIDLVRGVADSGRFADDLSALLELMGETSREVGIGTLVLIDELQEASASDLTALNTAIHYLGQAPTPLPVMVVGAGLPSLPAQLAEATSYAERLYEYRGIGLLDASAARSALVTPTADRSVEWREDALHEALELASGYPYFLQAVGKHVWDVAQRSPISSEDVRIGSELARREVDEGLYRSRWERATPGQRELLRALARLGGEQAASVAELAQSLGKKQVSHLSVARDELIKKGLVFAPERGMLAFTVPGMSDFIMRQA